MSVPNEIYAFSAEDGLTFLEHLAHNLTIALRVAAEDRQPIGALTDEQSRKAIYWVNEATHNVVQLSRELRIGKENWDADDIAKWVELWMSYKHSAKYNTQAVNISIHQTLHPHVP